MKKVLVLLLAMVIGAWNLFPVGAADPVANRPMQRVTVAPGDTLWRIAERTTDGSEDLRQTIYVICRINDLNEAVYLTPGQQLMVPAPLAKGASR